MDSEILHTSPASANCNVLPTANIKSKAILLGENIKQQMKTYVYRRVHYNKIQCSVYIIHC